MNVVVVINQLHTEIESFKHDLLRSNTNKSANRRARKKSVQIRKSLKEIREQLLVLEKEMS
tara:strand:+ start:4038 stop:4220 length:183 start_codon:yes stop_codon:yes gene_type:complete